MRLFYWNAKPNLGDRLTDWLLRKEGVVPEWAPVPAADFVGIGSVLEWFDGSKATIWGAGRAGKQAPPLDLSRAEVLALRGKLTLARCTGASKSIGTGLPVLGDPGLLVAEHFRRYSGGGVVVMPHWQDVERMQATYPTATLVDPLAPDIDRALELFSRADRVVTSSLHGMVLADAFGAWRMWDWFDGVQGQGFKFRDYFSVIGKCEPGEWYMANTSVVRKTRTALKGVLSGYLKACAGAEVHGSADGTDEEGVPNAGHPRPRHADRR